MLDKALYYNPKRKKYTGHRSAEVCAFCNGAMENKFHILHTKYWMVVANQYPFIDYAILVIPVRHFEYVSEINEEEWKELGVVLSKLGRAWSKYYLNEHSRNDRVKVIDGNAASYNIYVNNGEFSGQSIRHLHWHFIPRVYRQDTVLEIVETFHKVKVTPRETQRLFKRILREVE